MTWKISMIQSPNQQGPANGAIPAPSINANNVTTATRLRRDVTSGGRCGQRPPTLENHKESPRNDGKIPWKKTIKHMEVAGKIWGNHLYMIFFNGKSA